MSRFSDQADELETVLDQLENDSLLSDPRFTASYIRLHINRGHGPIRIRQELQQKGVNSETIDNAMEEADTNWFDLAETARQKKFGDSIPCEPKEKARQIRFLQYRGFPVGIIMELF